MLLLGVLLSSTLYLKARSARNLAESNERLAREIIRFLNDDVLAAADADRSGRSDLTVQSLLARADEKLERGFAGQDAARADIGLTLGKAYLGLGVWPAADRCLSRALLDARKAHGMHDSTTLEIETQLAETRKLEARFAESAQLYAEVVNETTREFGAEDPRTLRARAGRARLWWEDDDIERARAELETLRPLAKTHAPELLTDIEWTLGELYPEVNRLADGEALMREVMQRSAVELGEHHPDRLWQGVSLGSILISEARWDEAETLFRNAANGFAALGGQAQPKYLSAVHYLGVILLEQGRAREALPLLEQAMNGRMQVQGELHRFTHDSMNRVGEALIQLGRPQDAIALLQPALQLADQSGNRKRADVLSILDTLAEAQIAAGRLDLAEPLLDQGMAMAVTTVPAENLRVGLLLRTAGSLRARQGRWSEAHECFEKALAIFSKALGVQHPLIAEMRAAVDLKSDLPLR